MDTFIGFLLTLIASVWSILNIILFVKLWNMTNEFKELRDWLMDERFSAPHLDIQAQSFPPSYGNVNEELSYQTVQTKTFAETLKKGDKVSIEGYGTCTFEGVWQGKYAFYPVRQTNLPDSPYLVNDFEPYLLIPQNKLGCLIV